MRIIIGILFIITSFTGCLRNFPPELQNLAPVDIRVVRGDEPVDGVLIVLYDKTPQGVLSCNGVTNQQGVATIKTSVPSASALGAKPGTYAVVLSKNPVLPPDLAADDGDSDPALDAKRLEFVEKNRIIPNVLEDPETSPVSLTVESKAVATLTVDIAEY